MISLIVTVHHLSSTLVQVIDSFFVQKNLHEIIVIDDASEENIAEVLIPFCQKYPLIELHVIRNENKMGAAFCRKKGIEVAKSDYILFADDQLLLEKNYTEICLKKILNSKGDLISGRLCYREPGESISSAVKRFKKGFISSRLFDFFRFRLVNEAVFDCDISIPFTHSVYLCRKSLILSVEIDIYYVKGNGFREENDLQLLLLNKGARILMTNDTHCVHLHSSEIRVGGKKIGIIEKFYWTLYYSHYFFKKHYDVLKKNVPLPWGRTFAFHLYCLLEFDAFFIRPILNFPTLFIKKLAREKN